MKASPSPAPPRLDPWRLHLHDVLHELGILPGVVADNLAVGIAAYCSQYHPRGLHSRDLRLLIARGFCSVGDRMAARCVIESMEPHCRHVERWLEILTELHHFPDLLPLFSRGVIRPADWAGARLDRMWILDFGRLVLTDAERHELMLYRSVRRLVDTMAPFWDATGGEGILGLKSLRALQVATGRRGMTEDLISPAELIGFIGEVLGHHQTRRGWRAIPELFNLDL